MNVMKTLWEMNNFKDAATTVDGAIIFLRKNWNNLL